MAHQALGDFVVIRRLVDNQSAGGIYLPEKHHELIHRGRVLSVGEDIGSDPSLPPVSDGDVIRYIPSGIIFEDGIEAVKYENIISRELVK